MSLKITPQAAHFEGICAADELEMLLSWVRSEAQPYADLGACDHLHAALLQVLLAHRVSVTRLPLDPWLRQTLAPLARLPFATKHTASGPDAAARTPLAEPR